eukprot:4328285-Amphidinium_carterae.2
MVANEYFAPPLADLADEGSHAALGYLSLHTSAHSRHVHGISGTAVCALIAEHLPCSCAPHITFCI